MTPTPEQPSPSVSVSRELLESLVMDVRNAAFCLDISSALTRQAVHGALNTAVAVQAEIDAALIQPQPEAPALPAERWIPVGERLPEDDYEDVLAWTGTGIWMAITINRRWYTVNGPRKGLYVTHWQPLPEPPADRLRALAGAEEMEEITAEEFVAREGPAWAHVGNAVDHVRSLRGDAPPPSALTDRWRAEALRHLDSDVVEPDTRAYAQALQKCADELEGREDGPPTR